MQLTISLDVPLTYNMTGGRIDSAYHGALTTLNVTQKGYWQIPIDGVQVENKGNTSSLGSMAKGQAIIDTGTPLIVAPIAVASKLYKSIGGAPVDASATPTIYSYRCDAPVKVSLLFAGKPFVIDPADFNAWQLNATHCQGAVMGAAVNDPKANNYGKSTTAPSINSRIFDNGWLT